MPRIDVLAAPRRSASLLVTTLLLVAAGCITADGTIEPDGKTTLTVSYPTNATAKSDFLARAMVSSPDVTVESLEIVDAEPVARRRRRATAKLRTDDVTAFGQMPLFRAFGTTITHDRKPSGGGTLTVTLRNAQPKDPDTPQVTNMMKHQVRVAIALPGAIVETSATEKDGRVEWTFPAGDFFAGKKLELTATYAASESGHAKATGNGTEEKKAATEKGIGAEEKKATTEEGTDTEEKEAATDEKKADAEQKKGGAE
jgi:hypothetical protein